MTRTSSIPRLAAVLSLLLCLGAAALAAWGPVVTVTPTSAQIAWRNTPPAATGIRVGDRLDPGEATDDYRLVTLTDLQPNTAYTYVFLTAAGEQTYTFHTAPADETPFTFVVYGDTRTGHDVHRKLATAIAKAEPRFIVNSGDAVANGKLEREWTAFFDIATPLTATTPYVIAPGNHEGNADYFYKLFPTPPGGGELNREWYTFDYGMVRVIILNSTRNIEAQQAWLDAYLTEHGAERRWTLVAFHYPLFSSGDRNGDANLREKWLPLLAKHHVDAAFHGHDHFYERSVYQAMPLIITGGGGAPLYPVNRKPNPLQQYAESVNHWLQLDVTPTTLRIRMFRLDGTLGDECVLTKPVEGN